MTHNNGIWLSTLSTVLFTVQFEFKHCNLLAAEIECGAVSAGATNKRFALTRPWSVPLALLVQSWEVCSSAEVWGAVEGVYRGGSLSRKISRHLLFRQGKQQWFQLTLTVQDTSLQRQSLATTWIHHWQSPTRACSNNVGNNSTHWLPHPCPTQSSLPADELVLAVLAWWYHSIVIGATQSDTVTVTPWETVFKTTLAQNEDWFKISMFGVGRQNKLVTTFSAFFDGGILGLTEGISPP